MKICNVQHVFSWYCMGSATHRAQAQIRMGPPLYLFFHGRATRRLVCRLGVGAWDCRAHDKNVLGIASRLSMGRAAW